MPKWILPFWLVRVADSKNLSATDNICMFTAILLILYLFNASFSPALSYESKYSDGIARLERAWLHKEYQNEEDEIRLSRLEEKVFGTIHDNDTKSRYTQLRKAFDAQQKMRRHAPRHDMSFMRGVPTSVPISVYDLYRGY